MSLNNKSEKVEIKASQKEFKKTEYSDQIIHSGAKLPILKSEDID